jgi:glyceraldehyde-3-phosphate dehydrogenase/erythrose-4-phosphate dehydrogenase
MDSGESAGWAFRAALERNDVEIVAVNELLERPHLAYLVKHDSVHGKLRQEVTTDGGALIVAGRRVRATAVKDPAASAWHEVGADAVIESTGAFLTQEKTEAHLPAGVAAGASRTLARSRPALPCHPLPPLRVQANRTENTTICLIGKEP